MADSSFGSGWPSSNPRIVTLVRRDGLRLPIHSELDELISMLMDLTELSGYNIKPGETWGYSNRPISGTRIPSNHSWGTAVDINAPSNPYASREWHRRNARGTRPFGLALVCNIPQKCVSLWEGNGFRWGGRYYEKPDPMHFEFLGSVSYARAKTAAMKDFLTKPKLVQFGDWPNKTNKPNLKPGSTGEAVKYLQKVILAKGGAYITVDGVFGPHTQSRVSQVQRVFKLGSYDGLVGPKTWACIDFMAKS